MHEYAVSITLLQVFFKDRNPNHVLWFGWESVSCWDFTFLPFITLSFSKPGDS